MKNLRFTLSITFFFVVIVQWSCLKNADRGNPLDPKSNNFVNTGRISGQTSTVTVPSMPIPDVEVRLEPGTFIARTNSEGKFIFTDIPAGKYNVFASKEGYASVKDSVIAEFGNKAEVNLRLDGLPVISSFSMITSHIQRWFPSNDLKLLEINAQIDDPDGLNDIALVRVDIPEISFTDTLEITRTLGNYQKKISEKDLPGENLHDLVGRKIFLTALDKAGFESTSEPKFIVRIIEDIPEAVFPIGLQNLNVPKPTLFWTKKEYPFNWTYNVEVWLLADNAVERIVWFKSGISKLETSITVADSLSRGETYFWMVSVVDDFGNWGRTKEASFKITK